MIARPLKQEQCHIKPAPFDAGNDDERETATEWEG